MTGAKAHQMPCGRLHLQHGPIDLVCEAWGSPRDVAIAYARATARFDRLLEELVSELPALRTENKALHGQIARKMAQAVAPFRPLFITPMAAVAGAVADAVLAAMVVPGLDRAYVNNGGDIALHLAHDQRLTCAVAGTKTRIVVQSHDPVRGIATSGWRGRSWSLGIADSVSVLARTAAMADAAATMIANAVDLRGHPAITRRPARDMQSDSDLGSRLVTVGVGALSAADIAAALDRGSAAADRHHAARLIVAAQLCLQGEQRLVGSLCLKEVVHA